MKLFQKQKIESFEKIAWHISGMRGICDYEIFPKEGVAEVFEYQRCYGKDKDDRRLERSGSCSVEEMLDLLNECNVFGWNGFHGAHPKHVKDGEMFSFEATVNDGTVIKAEGSANFPKHFWNFQRAIGEILNG